MSRRKKSLPQETVALTIDSMSHDGRGVARVDGKTVFVTGALPGEQVTANYLAQKKQHDELIVNEVLTASADRVTPACKHADICGGCSLQYMTSDAQILSKQQALLDGLSHMAKLTPEQLLPSLTANPWGYRRKARLGVRYVHKKGKVLVGFREKRSSFLAELSECKVLHPSVGTRLLDLGELIHAMDAPDKWPQIEVAVGDERTHLVFRHLEPLSDADDQRLRSFAQANPEFAVLVQPGKPDSIAPVLDEEPELFYRLEKEIRIDFKPSDFMQVNGGINQSMIHQAMHWLELKETDRVLDLFCGLGNFTLPMAQKAAWVTGVEGDAQMVQRAKQSALNNGITNTDYYCFDLTQDALQEPWLKHGYDKVLLDPPRAGAEAILPHVAASGAKRVVYVSCHPGTLARDAKILCHQYGYSLIAAGVMDMFPHTAHTESMAVFDLR